MICLHIGQGLQAISMAPDALFDRLLLATHAGPGVVSSIAVTEYQREIAGRCPERGVPASGP